MVHFRFGRIRWQDTCESAFKDESHVSSNQNPAEAKVDHLLLTIIFYDCFD